MIDSSVTCDTVSLTFICLTQHVVWVGCGVKEICFEDGVIKL